MSIQKYFICQQSDRERLALILVMRRNELNISKRQIVKEHGMTIQSINFIEKGRPVNEALFRKYLIALDCDIEMSLITEKTKEE